MAAVPGIRGWILILACALGVGVCAAGESDRPATLPPWIPVDEQLRYRVSWGGILVGEVQASLTRVEENGRHLLAATYRARSNRVLRQIYPVEDEMTTTIDPVDFLPVVFRMNMREGSHIRLETIAFDYAAEKAVWRAAGKNKTKVFALDRETHDLLSLMYFVRKEGIQNGSNRTVRVLSNGKVFNLPIRVDGRESVKVPGHGAVDCLRLVPTVPFDGLFVNSGGITFWCSADAHFICTRAQASIPVGSITATLTEWNRPDAKNAKFGERGVKPPMNTDEHGSIQSESIGVHR